MPSLSWDNFLKKVAAYPGKAVPAAELVRLVHQLDVTEELLAPHISWCTETYQRNPLFRSDKLEVLVLCWEDGQETVIHDHGPSCSVAKVISGVTKLENFKRVDNGERAGFANLECTECIDVNPGAVCGSEVGFIHSMGNMQGERKRMVTINLYSPPLSRIQTFDRATGKIGEKVYPELLATL